MAEDLSPFLPLWPATLHILLSLAGENRHGYGIMQEVARQSEGQYKLGPGTLYDNLQKMTEQGLVEGVAKRSGIRIPGRILPADFVWAAGADGGDCPAGKCRAGG